jgi:hypothetical protein
MGEAGEASVEAGAAFQELMWSDLKEEQCFPIQRPMLAHYSSVQSLEGIVKSEELWLSHPMLMNDHEELRWGLLEGRRIFLEHSGLVEACETPERYQSLLSSFTYYFDRFSNEYAHNVYVACFCKHAPNDDDGLLSMWRAYGASGGGVAIVFDTAKLSPREQSPLMLHPVSYLSTEERLGWIGIKLDQLASLLKKTRPRDEDLWYAAWHYFFRLKHFSIFTKHKGFAEENEWRLVYSPDHDETEEFTEMLGYCIDERGIHPKLKLRLGAHSSGLAFVPLKEVVTSILLGPTASSYLSQVAVKRMLSALGQPELADRVRMCTTPFRPI